MTYFKSLVKLACVKKLFLSIFLFLIWSNISNIANAAPKTNSGKGELFLSEKIIEGYYEYLTKPLNKLPLLFFISEDQNYFYTIIIKQDNKGYAGSGYIKDKPLNVRKN